MKTTCGIEKNYILLIGLGMLNSCLCNVNRALLVSHGKDFHALLLSIDLKLCDRCRTIDVTCDQERSFSLGFELACKLGNCGCLTCTLKTCHHQYGDLISLFQGKLCCLASHQAYKFVINDLDHHLSRIQSVHNILSDCTFLYRFRELLHNLKVYIRLKKSHLDFFQSNLNIFLCKSAFTSQLFEYIL